MIAALCDKLECFKYLYENGCTINDDICCAAATSLCNSNGNNSLCLKFIYNQGYKWTCTNASFKLANLAWNKWIENDEKN